MKANYEITLKLNIMHDIDKLTNLKDAHELANDIVHMICDEATMCNGVATYEILNSTLNVK